MYGLLFMYYNIYNIILYYILILNHNSISEHRKDSFLL